MCIIPVYQTHGTGVLIASLECNSERSGTSCIMHSHFNGLQWRWCCCLAYEWEATNKFWQKLVITLTWLKLPDRGVVFKVRIAAHVVGKNQKRDQKNMVKNHLPSIESDATRILMELAVIKVQSDKYERDFNAV